MASQICIMCKSDIDDPLQFGEKTTIKGISAHQFCLLLSGCLPQNGSDDDGIIGFLPHDIKKEVLRAKKQRCTFCRQSGANISCCQKKSRKTFHLPCAVKRDCRFEFVDRFQSFCEEHHEIQTPIRCHQPADACAICHEEMGEYNAIQSIRPACCESSNSWFHKLCLQKYASTAGYLLKCPLCNESKSFRDDIMRRGVFIPDKDAKWEEKEESTFYGFEQSNGRPTECVADYCRNNQGRMNYIDKNGEYSLVLCGSCGSNGIHKCCMNGQNVFVCDDCDYKPPAKKQRKMNDHDISIYRTDKVNNDNKNNNSKMSLTNADLKKTDAEYFERIGVFKPLKFRIVVPNLTEKDIRDLMKKRKSKMMNQS